MSHVAGVEDGVQKLALLSMVITLKSIKLSIILFDEVLRQIKYLASPINLFQERPQTNWTTTVDLDVKPQRDGNISQQEKLCLFIDILVLHNNTVQGHWIEHEEHPSLGANFSILISGDRQA